MSDLRDDERLRSLLRRIDPAQAASDAGPPAFLRALRDRLAAEQAAARSRERRRASRRFGWTLAVASLVVVATVSVSVALGGQRAEAVSPVPLSFTAPVPVPQVVAEATDALSGPAGVENPARRVHTISWAISIDDGELQAAVTPQIVELEWNPDLSGHSLVVEGRVQPGSDGGPGRVSATDTVVSQVTFAPGEFGVPSPEAPPATVAGMTELLTMYGMPEHPSAGDLVQSMVTVMDYWTLSDTQHAVLLEMLVSTGGAASLGQSVDRLGRDVAGVQIASTIDGLTDTVLLSSDSGRIVGVETMRTVADETVPAGTVVEYRMWDSQEEQ